MRSLFCYSFFIFMLFSCQNDTPNTSVVTIENTPKAVAQYWLENYFADRFELAKKYSTPSTQTMIDTIQGIIFTESIKEIEFKITAVQCEEKEDSAKCTYIYVEAEEKIPETIDLKKVNGNWLVDAKLIEEAEGVEEFLKENDLEELFK